MAEDGAATATETTEGANAAEENQGATGTEGAQGSERSTTEEDKPLGPEGEKALEAFKVRARKAEQKVKDLESKIDKFEEASKSETEKALDKARKEAKAEAQSEFEKERRADRLQVAVAGHARELADVDDVVLNLERGDLDELFDDEGKIEKKALEKRLEQLLKDKPHLKAGGVGKPRGSANGGEGEGNEAPSFNELLRDRA